MRDDRNISRQRIETPRTIEPDELVRMRQAASSRMVASDTPLNFKKTDMDAAFQALEDWWGPHYSPVSALIDGVTEASLTVAQKYMILSEWMRAKADEYGGLS